MAQIKGSKGNDIVVGSSDDDLITGEKGNDVLHGENGDDLLDGGEGDDVLVGGAGLDTAYFSGKASDYEITTSGLTTTVRYLKKGANQGVDSLLGVERLVFADGTVVFLSANQDPIAGADFATVLEGAVLEGGLLANDSDPDGDLVTLTAVNGAPMKKHGLTLTLDSGAIVTVMPDGSYRYDQNGAFDHLATGPGGAPQTAVDSFTYTVSDGMGGTATATVTITVQGVSAQPPIASEIGDRAALEDSAFSFTIPAGTFSDPDGGALTLSSALADGSPLPGWLSFDPVTGRFSGTPAYGDVGAYEIRVTASDGSGAASSVFTLTVSNVNDAPVGIPAAASGDEDGGPITGSVAGTDEEGDVLSYALAGDEVAGLTFNADGTYSYSPPVNFNGQVSFDYVASDGDLTSAPATVTITISPVNDAPQVGESIASQQADALEAFSFQLPADAFVDIDLGDLLSYSATLADGSPLPSWLTFDPATRTFSGTPGTFDAGPVELRVSATDSAGLAAETLFSIEVLAANQAPLALGSFIETNAGAAISGRLGAQDADNDPLTFGLVSGPLHGTLELQPDGRYQYTPDAGYTGPDNFAFQVSDGMGGVSIGQAQVNVAEPVGPFRRLGDLFEAQVASGPFDLATPEVAALSDGGHVVVWAVSDPAAGSADWGIYGQRYDEHGEAVGTVFQVNATAGQALDPAVAALAGGGFVVVWEVSGPDGSGSGIYAQAFDIAGAPAGAEFRINSTTAGDQADASVTPLASGGFAVTWRNGSDADHDVILRVFNADRSPATAEILVSPNGSQLETGGGFAPESVTTLANGDIVVVWTEIGVDLDVRAQVFAADGASVTGPWTVNSTSLFDQNMASVGALADGGFMVVWSGVSSSDATAIMGQRYDAAGQPVGGEVFVNTWTESDQVNAHVVGLSDGGYVVVWQSKDAHRANAFTLEGQRYDASSQPVGGEFRFHGPEAQQTFPSIDVRADGALVVVWSYGTLAAGSQYANTIDQAIVSDFEADTTPADILLDERVGSTSGQHDSPESAALESGGHVVVWTASGGAAGYEVHAQLYDAAGAPVGTDFRVNADTDGDQKGPSVAPLPGGGFVIIWETDALDGSLDLIGQVFNAAGQRVGAEFPINTVTATDQQGASVSALADGGFAVTWQSGGPGSADVLLRIFNADGSPATAEMQVAQAPAGDELTLGLAAQTIATLGDGNILVTWTDGGLDGSGYGIAARMFTAEGIPAGDEFLVNQTTSGDQLEGSVAALTGGGFVITWTDTFDNTVYSRRYNAIGQPVGPEVLVNSFTRDFQGHSKVVALTDGGYVVIWQSFEVEDRSSDSICGQRFDAAGQRVGGEFIVDSDGRADARLPSAALREDGALVIVWLQGEAGEQVSQVVVEDIASDTRALEDVLGERVGDTVGGAQSPQVASLGDGHVVVWSAFGQAADSTNGVYGQRYDAGGRPIGGSFLINSTTAGSQTNPSVAELADGRFVVIWDSPDGSSSGVFGRLFNADGSPAGGEFQVNTLANNAQQLSSVAALPGGGFAVTWQGHDQVSASLSATDVYLRIYDANASPVTGEILVSNTSAGQIEATDGGFAETITVLVNGNIVVTWRDAAADPGVGIMARIFEPDGDPVTAEFRVNTTAEGTQQHASVTALGDGGFIVAWTDSGGADGSGGGIFSQRFDAAGTPIGGETQVNVWTTDTQSAPHVANLPDGGYLIVWESVLAEGENNTVIAGRRYDADGAAVGGEFLISPPGGERHVNPSVTLTGDGSLVVVWLAGGDPQLSQVIIDDFNGVFQAKILVGGAGNDSFLGSDFADQIDGAAGDDRIEGLGGADFLRGGAGADVFAYAATAAGGDVILDFSAGEDQLHFGAAFSVGAPDGQVGFFAGDAPLATGAGPVFLYDTLDGGLWFDADGAGTLEAVRIAVLQGVPLLGADSFLIDGGEVITLLGSGSGS